MWILTFKVTFITFILFIILDIIPYYFILLGLQLKVIINKPTQNLEALQVNLIR